MRAKEGNDVAAPAPAPATPAGGIVPRRAWATRERAVALALQFARASEHPKATGVRGPELASYRAQIRPKRPPLAVPAHQPAKPRQEPTRPHPYPRRPSARRRYGASVAPKIAVMWLPSLWTSAPPTTGKQRVASHM